PPGWIPVQCWRKRGRAQSHPSCRAVPARAGVYPPGRRSPVRAAHASDSCQSRPAPADADHVRGSARAAAARFLPARRWSSRWTSVQSVSSSPSPLAPWLKLRVNHLISGTATLSTILACTARTPCRLLGIAARSQAGGELLQVARELP